MSKSTHHQQKMFSVVEEFRQSKLTRLDFCKQNNIPVSKFYYWQKKFREHSSETPNGFIRLASGKSHQMTDPLGLIVLQYPNGVSLQLPAGTPVATLRTLLSLA